MNLCVCHAFNTPLAGTDLVIIPPQKDYMQEWEAKTFLEKAAAYVKEHNVWLLTPAFALREHIAVCLINPAGKPVLLQRAHHLTPTLQTGYHPAEPPVAMDTPFGRILFLVDVDIYDPAVVDIATREQCSCIVAQQFMSAMDFSKERLLFGVWSAAQQTGLSVVGVSNQGCCVTEPCRAGHRDTPNGFAVPFSDQIPLYCTV